MVTGLDAGRWNARGLVLVPRIPQAQVRREGLPPTRLRRVPIGKQRRMPRQSPAWRKLRSREGSTYIVDYFIPVWGTSVETNSPHASSRCQAAYRGHPYHGSVWWRVGWACDSRLRDERSALNGWD